MKRKKKSIFIAVLLLCAVTCIAVLSWLLIKKNNESGAGQEVSLTFDTKDVGEIGIYHETVSTVPREIPIQTQNEGLCVRYPAYGTNLADITDEEKDSILKEDSLLRVSASTYTEIDQDGNLLLKGETTGRKLYKHTASVGMYYGDVSDNEKAVVEKITLRPKEWRNYITGLYAPAGEVVKIEISEEDLAKVGSLEVSVGQISLINKNNNIWKEKNFVRMPNLGNIFKINKTTAYVGNFLGGPIYVKASKINIEYTVTISGAVKYPYYIHGLTTKQEFEEMKNLSAPYYDFEVWDTSVRHSGPKSYANFDYDNLVKVGDLWENVSRTSRLVPATSNPGMSIGFLYDVFVAAGAACAFQGANWVNAPCNWMKGALDYQVMTSSGFWGHIHEFNHHFQNYGIAPNGEVTNNATSLLSYVLYTNISANRSENDNDLPSWNRYTDATRGLRETLANAGSEQTSLNIYADILHNFGVDTFIQATRLQPTRTHTADAWYEGLSKATGYNMTYYFENLIGQTLSNSVKKLYDTPDKNVFVPVAMLYQTGRNYFYEGEEKFIETVKPYQIIKGQEYTIDFEKNTYLPSDFTWTIKKITMPKNGTLTKISDKKYSYINNEKGESGTFYVTISLNKEGVTTPDVTFSINLKTVDPKPTKTLYIYDTRKYEQTDEALNANFEGYTNKTISYASTTFMNHIANKQIGVVEGKIYIEKDGEYTICLRAGRGNHALYTSLTGQDYTKDIAFSGDSGGFDFKENHIKKYTLKKGQYLYYKQITISNGHSDAFTELGITSNEDAPKTVPASVLYNKDGDGYVPYNFTFKPIFAREYLEITNLITSTATKQRVISSNFESWDNNTKIENICDGNENTYFHNKQNQFVSEDNPYELVMDLGEEIYCNKITLIGRKTNQANLPCTFKLYAGINQDNMTLIGDYTGLDLVNRTTSAEFDAQKIRYYKLVVTDTKSDGTGYRKYVSIAQINFGISINGKKYNASKLNYSKIDNRTFEEIKTPSTFGNVIKGDGSITYSFVGSRFGLFVKQNSNAIIKVILDGQSETINLTASNKQELAFLSQKLNNGNHNIKISVIEGKISVDSFVIC